MRAIDCDRHGCKLQDGKTYSYDALRYDWICVECEGRLVHQSQRDPDTEIITDWIECGRCGGREIKRVSSVRGEQVRAVEVLAGLPIELRKAAEKARRRRDQEALKGAASLLY